MFGRRLFVGIVLLVVCAALALPAGISAHVGTSNTQSQIQALTDAKDLARFMPADSVFYANIRLDDGYIDLLDTLIERITSKLPANLLPPMLSQPKLLRTQLEAALKTAGLDYQNDIRSWLGDRAALSVGSIAGVMASAKTPANMPVLLAIEVTDKAKTEAFIDALLARGKATDFFKKTPSDTETTYLSALPQLPVEIAVRQGVLFIGTPASISAVDTKSAKLDQSQKFTDTMSLLTAPSYSQLFYIDVPEVLKVSAATMTRNMTPDRTKMLQDIINGLGPEAIGLTVQDDSALTIDVALKIADKTKFESAGIKLPMGKSVKPEFDAYIPDNAIAIIHGTDIKNSIDSALASLQSAAAASSNPSNADSVKRSLDQLTNALKAFTGLDLQTDILGWLTGDFAMFIGYDVPEPGAPSLITSVLTASLDKTQKVTYGGLDFGLVIEAADPAKAQNMVAKLSDALPKFAASAKDVKISTEEISGAKALVLSVSSPQLANTVDLVIAANDKVFVIATRDAATKVLSGSGGLDKNEVYAAASKYFVAKPLQVYYLNRNALNLLGDFGAISAVAFTVSKGSIMGMLSGTPTPTPQPASEILPGVLAQYKQFQMLVRQVTSIVDSASITSSITDNGDIVGRAVLTLGK